MKTKISLLFVALIILSNGFSQDPLFNNTNQSLVYLNPSFAGINGGVRNQFSYYNQWPNLSGTYVTALNSFDAYIKKIKGGVSFSALHDDQAHGVLKTDVFSLGYAQHFSLLEGKLKIIPSLQASYLREKLDKTRLNFGDPLNARYNMVWNFSAGISNIRQVIDFNSALLINYKNFYFGTSVFHVNQPDIGLSTIFKLPSRFSIHGSYNLHLSEKTALNFFINYQKQQNYQFTQFVFNALFKKHLLVGAGYKYASNVFVDQSYYGRYITNVYYNVVNVNIGYRNNFYVISLGYNANISKLAGNTAGSWELNASFNLRNKENRKVITDFERW